MDLQHACRLPQLNQAAFLYHDAGLSVIPVQGKKPLIQWKAYQEQSPERKDIYQWFHKLNPAPTGLAIITGTVSDNLVIVDLDGHNAVAAFYSEFPHLTSTHTVLTSRGRHLYFQTEEPTITLKAANIADGTIDEIALRSDRCYTLAPPSVHPSGVRYVQLEPAQPVRTVPNLNNVINWLGAQIAAKHKPQKRRPVYPAPRSNGRNSAYVQTALNNELDAVRNAPVGSRNNTLFLAAIRLGQLVANPVSGLTRVEVEDKLTEAAASLVQEDGLHAVRSTILSGLKRGLTEPRAIPEVRYGA